MSDIVRLLNGIKLYTSGGEVSDLPETAADTITALRAEVEDLGNRLHHVHRLWANNEHALRAEVERFKVSLSDAVRQTQEQANDITALRAALTPSAETKAAYIGEFHFTEESYDEDGQVYYRKVAVPWTIIKEIMAAISARAALEEKP